MSNDWDKLDVSDYYHIPRTCVKCGQVMVFQGLGEYKCEECGFFAYDDYGKVRSYIERHRGANAIEVETATGVSRRTIQKMLKDARIEVAFSSKTFLKCEMCGKDIRSGELCPSCEMTMHRHLEERQREEIRSHAKAGTSKSEGNSGQRRYSRDSSEG